MGHELYVNANVLLAHACFNSFLRVRTWDLISEPFPGDILVVGYDVGLRVVSSAWRAVDRTKRCEASDNSVIE
jgi:hypothetical protein